MVKIISTATLKFLISVAIEGDVSYISPAREEELLMQITEKNYILLPGEFVLADYLLFPVNSLNTCSNQ